MPAVAAKPDVLLKKYSLQPAPESVARLATLVSKRMDDMEQVAKVIAADKALTARLLRAASPKKGPAIEDVEQAVFRLGVESILVLSMSDPLLRAVARTFDTMLAITLEAVDEATVGPMDVSGFIACVGFTGRATGKVFIRMRENFGRQIGAKILGTEPDALTPQDVTDVLGEMANMIVGNFKSNLCDAGLSCKLSVPDVKAANDFEPPDVPMGRHQCFAFRHDGLPVIIDIVVESAE